MMLATLNLLRLEEFMLFVLCGFFRDGEYSDLRPSMEEYYEADTDSTTLEKTILYVAYGWESVSASLGFKTKSLSR